jgi:hypothetical protein
VKILPHIPLGSLRIPAGMQGIVDTLKKGSPRISAVSAVAGTGIELVSATRDERAYLSEIADEYRPEIAERLGLAVDQVTEGHYQAAFAENPVLAQAQEAAKMKGVVRAANMAISTGVGVLAGMAASAFSRPKPGMSGAEDKGKDPANIAGGVAATIGAAAIGKLMRKVTHTNHLGKAMENTAHHKIMLIKEKQQRGEETTPADIFEVQLALNPEVGKTIKAATGKRFDALDAAEKQQMLRSEFPDIFEVNAVMAQRINKDGMRPQQLVFGEVRAAAQEVPLGAGHPDLPPNASAALPVEPEAVEASQAAEAVETMLQQQAQQTAEKTKSHVERLERAAPPSEREKFANRIEASRAQQAETATQR